jgi:hypothetical protein
MRKGSGRSRIRHSGQEFTRKRKYIGWGNLFDTLQGDDFVSKPINYGAIFPFISFSMSDFERSGA